MVEWVCLQHPSYKLTAPADLPPKCNHSIVIRRVLQPCGKFMWTPDVQWAEAAAE